MAHEYLLWIIPISEPFFILKYLIILSYLTEHSWKVTMQHDDQLNDPSNIHTLYINPHQTWQSFLYIKQNTRSHYERQFVSKVEFLMVL